MKKNPGSSGLNDIKSVKKSGHQTNPEWIWSSSLKICLLILAASLLSFTDVTDNKTHLNDIRIERHKAIPMTDGTILYGDVYMPSAPGKYPTLVTRTPYGVQRDGMHENCVKFAQHGYAILAVDVRGRYESEGKWEPFRYEGKDGYDIIEWEIGRAHV